MKAAEARLAAAAPGPDMRASDASSPKPSAVADARAMNPMFRVAAAWQRTPVGTGTASKQFEVVKHWAVIALSDATALPLLWRRSSARAARARRTPSKLAMALRRMIARAARRCAALVMDAGGISRPCEIHLCAV